MKLKIDDKVEWRDSWGCDSPKIATIESISTNCVDKDGIRADEVEWYKVKDESVIVGLTNGSWAYGYQIRQLKEKSK